MNPFEDMRIFSQVMESGSFTAAADKLGLSKQFVSRRVMALEERLGVRLLNRSTRRLDPTPLGQLFLRHVARTAQILQILFETHVRPFVEFPYRLDLRLLAIAKQQLVINVAFHATILRLHCDSQPNFATQPTVARREVGFTGLLRQ